MTAKITLVNGESIRVEDGVDAVVSEINGALAANSLLSVKVARGRSIWINPAQIVQVEGGHAAEGGWRPAVG